MKLEVKFINLLYVDDRLIKFQIVMEHVLRGVVYHLGHVSAKEPVELVVDAATACHLALLETKKCVPAMLV